MSSLSILESESQHGSYKGKTMGNPLSDGKEADALSADQKLADITVLFPTLLYWVHDIELILI